MPDLPPPQATIEDLSEGLAAGRWSSVDLVSFYLRRVERFDAAFGAIRCVLPDASEQAARSDRVRRAQGPRSRLEGIPVVVKDNIDLAGIPTTGGALALEYSVPTADAPLVARLRAAGAVVMAKTNLSELANFLTENMPSGYSSLGGQVLNPYDTSITPSGSSSGSATAVALCLAPVAVGSETDGSITSPCDHQSLVGMKPTLGLVSRTGILPIAPSQDTAGPMTRTVGDAASLLAAIAGPDPADPATDAPDPVELGGPLDPAALGAARLGVIRKFAGEKASGRQSCYDAAVAALEFAGAELEEVELPTLGRDDELAVLHYEFAPAVDRYLGSLGPGAPVRSLAQLRDWNLAHREEALKFGQAHVDTALAVDHQVERASYEEARRRDHDSVVAAFEEAMGDRLEALVFPGTEGGSWAARAGWPSIVVPAGYAPANRRPVGLMLVSRPWTDRRLLSLALAVERSLPVRRPPWELNPAVFRRLGAP